MKTTFLSIISLLITSNSFAMGPKPVGPPPLSDQKVDVAYFYNAILKADTLGTLSPCKVNRDAIATSVSPDGGLAMFSVDSTNNANGRFSIYHLSGEYSDVTDASQVRTVRIASYEYRDSGFSPEWDKTIVLLRFKNDAIFSLKTWQLIGLRAATSNDPEPTDQKLGALICGGLSSN